MTQLTPAPLWQDKDFPESASPAIGWAYQPIIRDGTSSHVTFIIHHPPSHVGRENISAWRKQLAAAAAITSHH